MEVSINVKEDDTNEISSIAKILVDNYNKIETYLDRSKFARDLLSMRRHYSFTGEYSPVILTIPNIIICININNEVVIEVGNNTRYKVDIKTFFKKVLMQFNILKIDTI